MNDKTTPAPLVSVVSISYNQEQFIKDTLEGFVMQKTNFPFEVIISDDCSTDDTRNIISGFQKNHPAIIKPTFREENLGAVENFFDTFLNAKGKYIAICEGDDFWTHPEKLQRQVDFLEAHPEYTICFHSSIQHFENDPDMEDGIFPEDKSDLTIERLLRENFIQTTSVMYRRLDYSQIKPYDIMPSDWYLHIYHARYGSIGFLDEPMSVYRIYKGSLWYYESKEMSIGWLRDFASRNLRMYIVIRDLFNEAKHKEIIDKKFVSRAQRIIRAAESKGIDAWDILDQDILKELIALFKELIAAYDERFKNDTLRISELGEAGHALRQENEKLALELQSITSSKRYRFAEALAGPFKRKKGINDQ